LVEWFLYQVVQISKKKSTLLFQDVFPHPAHIIRRLFNLPMREARSFGIPRPVMDSTGKFPWFISLKMRTPFRAV
jgi:hypothetical protein